MNIKLIQTRPTLDCIIDTVAKVRNVGHVLIRSTRRYGKFILARCEAAFIARLFGYTLKQIAEALNRDHSTISHSLEAFRNEIEYNQNFRSAYETAWREVYAEAFDVKSDFDIHKSNILKQYYRAVI